MRVYFITGLMVFLFFLGCVNNTNPLGGISERADYIKCMEAFPNTYWQEGACTLQYDPVCGLSTNGEIKTYGNSCTACQTPQVDGYVPRECEELQMNK